MLTSPDHDDDLALLLDGLNEHQSEAVLAPGNTLVLAGAGSGKTRVLTHRIARLVQQGADPGSVMAMTFTRKAANEMSERLGDMLGWRAVKGMWVGTFHALARKVLIKHAAAAGLTPDFDIYDDSKQEGLIRRLMLEMGLPAPPKVLREYRSYINRCKDQGQRALGLTLDVKDPELANMRSVYRAYEARLRELGAVDYAELLLACHELFTDHPDIAREYQDKFRHVLVDEFQDTNDLQYTLLGQMTSKDSTLFAVGDDDQSIYAFRGAKVANVQRFQSDYDAATIRLERNYRSSGNILQAANHLISHNSGRMGKNLWTDMDAGDRLDTHVAANEYAEVDFVLSRIIPRLEDDPEREHAIIYRVNASSRLFEDGLAAAGIPYRVYGGERFYEREEIRYAMAMAMAVVNPDNDEAIEHILAMDTRFDDYLAGRIYQQAKQENKSIWAVITRAIGAPEDGEWYEEDVADMKRFAGTLAKVAKACAGVGPARAMKIVIEQGRILKYYTGQKGKGKTQVDNLSELIIAAKEHEDKAAGDVPKGLDGLQAFAAAFDQRARESEKIMAANEEEAKVSLSTVHSVKGLEFPHVYMVHMLEEVFPHKLSVTDKEIEEERRLAYVGITRAQQTLTLSLHDGEVYQRNPGAKGSLVSSRFLGELPPELLREVTYKPPYNQKLKWKGPDPKAPPKKPEPRTPAPTPGPGGGPPML